MKEGRLRCWNVLLIALEVTRWRSFRGGQTKSLRLEAMVALSAPLTKGVLVLGSCASEVSANDHKGAGSRGKLTWTPASSNWLVQLNPLSKTAVLIFQLTFRSSSAMEDSSSILWTSFGFRKAPTNPSRGCSRRAPSHGIVTRHVLCCGRKPLSWTKDTNKKGPSGGEPRQRAAFGCCGCW